MRAHEIMESFGPAEQMLMKLRKGMAASLNAARFRDILPYLPGWSIEKAKFQKPSFGGWIAKEVPGSHAHRSYMRSKDGRVHFTVHMPLAHKGSDHYEQSGRAEDERKVIQLRDIDYPRLVALSKTTQKKWNVRDVQIAEGPGQYANELDVNFEFIVEMNGFLITSPDGQTYEVYGDYKNDPVEMHTFESFFKWAVENTNIMDQILEALDMEPHEPKVDPRKPYTPPPTASAETKKVFELLKTMTADVRDQQKADRVAAMESSINSFMDAVKTDPEKAKRIAANESFILSRVYNTRDHKLADNWQNEVDRVAEEEVEHMQNLFVYKNTHKLAPILTAKGNMGKEEILGIDTRRGIITARLRFSFDDGSSFLVEQSIVASYARDSFNRITHFYRFPTTFHDVMLPGGVKMGMPSEERMNEIFAKA